MITDSIGFHFEDMDAISLKEQAIAAWLTDAIVSENKKPGTINCIFCSDEYLLKMNQIYLDHDTFTDIITFNYVEHEVISGDLFISLERVMENATNFGVEYLHELKRVMIHGVLHLIGYNDKTPQEAKEIRAKEDFYLTLLSD